MSEDTSKFLVWVQLPELPLGFWDEEVFKLIANTFGQYFHADPVTKFKKHLISAHFCVLVEENKVLLSQVALSSKYGVWVQQIVFEDLCVVCLCCCKVGHTSAKCPRNKNCHPVWRKKDQVVEDHTNDEDALKVESRGKAPINSNKIDTPSRLNDTARVLVKKKRLELENLCTMKQKSFKTLLLLSKINIE